MGEPRLIDHIGILVENLEEAIEKWQRATGYTFGPIGRYRTERYRDHSNPEPHWHDARIAFSQQGPPFIELMEFHGEGTHSAKEGEGFHHFGFLDYPDAHEKIAEMEAAGFRHDGESLDEQGRTILWFTDKRDLNGVRLEFVAAVPQPVVADDGEPLESSLVQLPEGWTDND
jgi:catechol 2,3-dioxygenase-like lactoylglutathione lyase family enzyme